MGDQTIRRSLPLPPRLGSSMYPRLGTPCDDRPGGIPILAADAILDFIYFTSCTSSSAEPFFFPLWQSTAGIGGVPALQATRNSAVESTPVRGPGFFRFILFASCWLDSAKNIHVDMQSLSTELRCETSQSLLLRALSDGLPLL